MSYTLIDFAPIPQELGIGVAEISRTRPINSARPQSLAGLDQVSGGQHSPYRTALKTSCHFMTVLPRESQVSADKTQCVKAWQRFVCENLHAETTFFCLIGFSGNKVFPLSQGSLEMSSRIFEMQKIKPSHCVRLENLTASTKQHRLHTPTKLGR